MSQTTEIQIQNQAGLPFRQKMNLMLSALNTTFSGADAPTTTEAGMFWLDTSTTPYTLRRRDDSNSTWEVAPIVEGVTVASTAKTTPADADLFPLTDSAAGNVLKKVTWADFKATLKTYFDTLYATTSGFTMSGLLKFAAGASKASAATVNLLTATGNTVHITGTTGISAWTMAAGQVMDVIFDGVLTLTHDATTNNLPSAANITTATGDRARYFYDGTTVYCLSYARADGTALVAPVSYAPSQQEFLTSGTFTVPDGVTSVYLSGIAGGGGGGSATSTTGSGGSSGAPGQQWLRQRVAVTPGSNISVTIGAGGSAVSAGGNTQFGANSLPGGAAGASGTGSIAYTPAGCGPATGTSTATVIGGAGHNTIWGLGGRGGSGSNGLAAQANSGAGGGGASNNGSSARTGGAGGSGYLLVEW